MYHEIISVQNIIDLLDSIGFAVSLKEDEIGAKYRKEIREYVLP